MSIYIKRLLYIPAIAGAVATGWPGSLFAASASTEQSSSSSGSSKKTIEEVVVTAQRTSQDIQEVPIAVTALSGQSMKDRQVITPSDLQMNAPNVSFTATNFGGSSFSIRGIGQLVIGGDPGVSTHINQIPIATNMNAVEFFDVQRVEVLRGPQGTLFGKNATGGVVNVVTNMPSYDSLKGNVDAEVGDYNDKRIKAAINVPFGDNFAIRIAGMKLKRDGYTDNLAYGQKSAADGSTLPGIKPTLDGRDLFGLRATASWQVTDALSAWFQYSRFHENDDKARITNQVCVTNSVPTTGCDPNAFGFQQPNLGTTTGGIFGGLLGALPLGAKGNETSVPAGFAPLVYDYPRPANIGFRSMHTDFQPVFQDDEYIYSTGVTYDFGKFNVGFLGAYQDTSYLSQQDYLMDVGPTLQPTSFNPSGIWPTSRPAGGAGADWKGGPCDLNSGTTGAVEGGGGCAYPNASSRVFAYDQSDSKGRYYYGEVKVQSQFDGKINFLFGLNTYHTTGYGDYYVLANTLDMVTSYGVPALGFPPLYPGYFDNTTDPAAQDVEKGTAAFGEVYYDFTPNLKFTAGLRFNKDDKETHSTSVLFNAVDVNYYLGGLLGPGHVWTRTTSFLFGDDTDVALGNLYAPDLVQAAIGTAALSPERFAVSAAVPLVPQANETRILTGSPDTAEWKKFSGRIGLNWHVNDNSMVYAFLSRGYKPGGFNPAIPPAFQSQSKFTFDAEQVNAFEVGSKNILMDGGLMLNGDFFYYNYGGLQVTRIANNTSLNDNIDARIFGVELESVWHPDAVPNLQIDGSYSYLHARVHGSQSVDPVNRTGNNPDWVLLENIDPGSLTGVNYVAKTSEITQTIVNNGLATGKILSDANGATLPGVTYPANAYGVALPAYESRSYLEGQGVETSDGIPVGLDGNKLPNSPDNTIHLGVAYTWNIDQIKGNLTARWDYYWQSEMYAREFNSVGDKIDAWDQHNASLIYESNDSHWAAKLWVRNIGNANNVTGKYLTSDTSGFFRNYFLTEPRIYGASVTYNFGNE